MTSDLKVKGRETTQQVQFQLRIVNGKLIADNLPNGSRGFPLKQTYVEWLTQNPALLAAFSENIRARVNRDKTGDVSKLLLGLKFRPEMLLIKWMSTEFPNNQDQVKALLRLEKINPNSRSERKVRHAQDDESRKHALEVLTNGIRPNFISNSGVREVYSERYNKSEKAKAFLERVYATELQHKAITLSELRKTDKSLWAGLRNWANAGNYDLDEIIPRGRTEPGPAPDRDLGFDPKSLDPRDPIQAAALKLAERRANNRQNMRRLRQAQKLG